MAWLQEQPDRHETDRGRIAAEHGLSIEEIDVVSELSRNPD
ncbi:hypothetical protein [Albidovulum aquaemixtae]|nr:hypothetical protein [Defluviimonas aquaemixtae]